MEITNGVITIHVDLLGERLIYLDKLRRVFEVNPATIAAHRELLHHDQSFIVKGKEQQSVYGTGWRIVSFLLPILRFDDPFIVSRERRIFLVRRVYSRCEHKKLEASFSEFKPPQFFPAGHLACRWRGINIAPIYRASYSVHLQIIAMQQESKG